MSPIFCQSYDMINELDFLEKLMPNYSVLLRKLSLVIRNNVWSKSKEKNLAYILHVINQVISDLVKMSGEQIELIEYYVELLKKYNKKYSSYDFSNYYDLILEQIGKSKVKEHIKDHWKQINPYFKQEYEKEDLFDKGFIEILEEFFDSIEEICSKDFLLPMNHTKFRHLIRGRRGEWKKKENLAAPTIEIAKKYNIINRWNPPTKRYLYLVAGDGSENDIETACQEMRIKDNEIVTIASFCYVGDYSRSKILDLDYDSIQEDDIYAFVENQLNEVENRILFRILQNGTAFSKEQIINEISKEKEWIKWLSSVYAGKIFLKEICDTIFVPLDQNEDESSEEKNKCYKSFHILAEYLEKRGYQGICYSSTRMKIIDKIGRNLVLFDPDTAEAVENTFITFTY